MNEISKAMEALEYTRRAVLREVNEGLDKMHTLDYNHIDEMNRLKLLEIEDNLREILHIMSN